MVTVEVEVGLAWAMTGELQHGWQKAGSCVQRQGLERVGLPHSFGGVWVGR